MTARGLFVTGTDTGIGKTRVAAGLLTALRLRGMTTGAMKPVASGCTAGSGGLRNDDALMLMAHATESFDYEEVNPYALADPIAPHLAAGDAGTDIDIPRLRELFRRLSARADWVVVEGVGGWQVPLGAATTVADLAHALALPVILVVGIRLGCLNHALLTAAAIDAAGLGPAGWVANMVDPHCARATDNVEALCARIRAPLLGTIPFNGTFDAAEIAACLDLDTLIENTGSRHAPG